MKHPPALPHGSLEELFADVFFIKGSVKLPMLMPMKMSRSMTIVRDPTTRDLTLINSMRLTDAGLEALEDLGRVRQVIRLAGFHGRDDGFYRSRYDAKILAIAGQHYSRSMDAAAPAANYLEPDRWLGEDDALPIASARLKVFESSTPSEAVLLIEREGGILITGDSLQNTPAPDEFVNFPARMMMKKMGFYQPHAVGLGWLQFAHPDAVDVRSVLDLQFEHVLPGHGDAVIGNAKRLYRPALEGALVGCHGLEL